jgi:DNA-binding response OmpR family regulator
MSSAKVLICRDDAGRVNDLEQPLRDRGYRVELLTCSDSTDSILADRSPDIIVIDSKTAGCELLEMIRKKTTVPLIVITALARADDRVRGLRGGADDVVSRPIDYDEIDARIEAVLRRMHPEVGKLNLIIDDLRKEVRVGDRVVSLSPTEFRLLKLLASSPGRVFTTQEILEELWPRSTTSYATGQDVQKYVYLLRKKLEESPRQPTVIITVRGFGYRLAD